MYFRLIGDDREFVFLCVILVSYDADRLLFEFTDLITIFYTKLIYKMYLK